jgi:hypothetical protein
MLIKSLWNITFFIKVFWTNLSNMQINQISKVAIQFPFFITFKTCSINIVIGTDVLMRNNVLGFAIFVTWGLDVMDLKVSGTLSFIYLEVKVLLCHNFSVSSLG